MTFSLALSCRWILFVFLFIQSGQVIAAAQNNGGISCVTPGHWLSPKNGSEIKQPELVKAMAKRPVVLLGEVHTNAEHHRWQLQILAGLYSHNPNMVLGFEAFPRAVQPVLDRWVRGELDKKEFIKLSRWNEFWRYDPDLYMPLFHFARMHRIPMRALNVERYLIRTVKDHGWASIEVGQREGVGDPLPPSKDYRESLTKVFEMHGEINKQKETPQSQTYQKRLESFIEVQTIWDRAMAEALAQVRMAGGEPLVVGIVGRGHVEYGFGISHQLSNLGINNAAVLLPWDKGLPCDQLKNRNNLPIADAVFGVDEPADATDLPHPMLGVKIETSAKGVRIIKVVKNSVAAAAGLEENDIIVQAASLKITRMIELVSTIRLMNPGTWLPLVILRDAKKLNIVAKFPLQVNSLQHP